MRCIILSYIEIVKMLDELKEAGKRLKRLEKAFCAELEVNQRLTATYDITGVKTANSGDSAILNALCREDDRKEKLQREMAAQNAIIDERWKMVDRLTQGDEDGRFLMLMRYLNGWELKRISIILDQTPRTVLRKLREAQQRMQKASERLKISHIANVS